MASSEEERLVDAAYRFDLALLANGQLTEESWKNCKTRAHEGYNTLVGLIRPWEAKTLEQRHGEEMTRLRDLYVKVCGDPKDPKFKAQLDAEVARMHREIEEAPTETAQEMVDRRLRERIVGRRRA